MGLQFEQRTNAVDDIGPEPVTSVPKWWYHLVACRRFRRSSFGLILNAAEDCESRQRWMERSNPGDLILHLGAGSDRIANRRLRLHGIARSGGTVFRQRLAFSGSPPLVQPVPFDIHRSKRLCRRKSFDPAYIVLLR